MRSTVFHVLFFSAKYQIITVDVLSATCPKIVTGREVYKPGTNQKVMHQVLNAEQEVSLTSPTFRVHIAKPQVQFPATKQLLFSGGQQNKMMPERTLSLKHIGNCFVLSGFRKQIFIRLEQRISRAKSLEFGVFTFLKDSQILNLRGVRKKYSRSL